MTDPYPTFRSSYCSSSYYKQGALELTVFKQDTANKAPGDVGFGSAFIPDDAEKFAELQLKELKNGRLAMVSIIGQFVQEKLTGQNPIEQFLDLTGSSF